MYLFDRPALERELRDYFEHGNACGDTLSALSACCERSASLPPELRKSALHRVIAEAAPLKLFGSFPFFGELPGARERYSWGIDSYYGAFMRRQREDEWLGAYRREIKPLTDAGLFHGWNPVGFDHHCPGYDTVLSDGTDAILVSLRERGRTAAAGEADFCAAAEESIASLNALALRFSAEAERAAQSAHGAERENYLRIASAAARVPMKPPRTFFEGLACVFFLRESLGNFEGCGFSTYGHLDRMLYPLYEADLAAGRTTRAEALALVSALLCYIETRFDKEHGLHETSSTIVIGGCGADGALVCNELTYIIIDAFRLGRFCGMKLLGRISAKHPPEYARALASLLCAGVPSFVYMNDDNYIPAEVRAGKAERDARLYVGGGCHEIVLEGTEVNTRADSWINLPLLLLQTIDKREYESFDELFVAYISDVRAFHDKICECKSRYERRWSELDPAPMYSATMADCIAKAADVTQGGARYNSTTLSMLGLATVADSLTAIEQLCYIQKRLPLRELAEICRRDFEGEEALRQYIITRLPKHGVGSSADALTARLMNALSQVSGQRNGRGGLYYPGFYCHDCYIYLGSRTPATPDGRRAGKPFSRGFAPSEFIETQSPLDIFASVRAVDFKAYPESFVTDITLPDMSGADGEAVVAKLAEAFVRAGGGTLQLNMTDREALLEARRNPETHRGLIVRVCGYSERFYVLTDTVKDEIISRATR